MKSRVSVVVGEVEAGHDSGGGSRQGSLSVEHDYRELSICKIPEK